MAEYTFLNTITNEEFDISMSFAEYDEYVIANPHLQQQIVSAPASVRASGLRGNAKPAEGFRDILKSIKKGHKNSKIETF